MVINGQWIYDNIIPTFSAHGDQVWIGIPSGSFSNGLGYNEYRVGITMYQVSTGEIFSRAFRSNGTSSYNVSSFLVDLKSLTESEIVSRLGIAFEFDSSQDVHVMYQDTGISGSDSASTTAVDDWVSAMLKTENIGTNTAQSIYIGVENTTMAEPDVTTDISTITSPLASASLTTQWTKALHFAGSSERAQQANSAYLYQPLNMGNISTTVSGGTAGNTSNASNARPWATAIVFSSDNHASNQHIWNCGEGAGSTDDNIYLRVDANRNLYFGWGRDGALNECSLGTLSSGSGNWYGIYIAHTGERLSGANATASNLADCFQIRGIDLSSGAVGSEMSTSSNWTTNGGRMDRQLTGSMTIGGRGANRNFHGKVASMVSTTLMRNAAMPSNSEISMMVRDPKQWLTDYKVGQTYRLSSGTTTLTFALSSLDSSYATQVWLMGDGTSDAYSQIRNQVHPASQNNTPLNMVSMVSSDIVTVTINGLT
jgi:hypothetical protein